jgi:hypothetical protein
MVQLQKPEVMIGDLKLWEYTATFLSRHLINPLQTPSNNDKKVMGEKGEK